jgi:hypothetical protein
MKIILSLLTALLLSNLTIAQTTAIPDINFEKALIDLGHDTGVPDGVVLTANINTIDILLLSSWQVDTTQKISDLTGIEDFANLDHLEFKGHHVANLDVSQNTALIWLRCDNNQLTSLDVSQNTALLYLYCPYNQLTHLDVSQNIVLDDLICNNNQLSSLNMKNGANSEIIFLSTNNNPNLTCVDVDDLIYSNTNWTSNNNHFNIDPHTSFSTDCATIPCSTVGISEFNLSSFSLYPNPATNQLSIDTELVINNLSIVDLTGKTITTTNQPTKLVDVSNLPSGIYFINVTTDENTITKKFVKQ